MRKRLGSVMGIGRRIGLDDEKGVAVAVFIALVIVGCVFAGYYVWLRPPAEEYNTIYLLDNQKQANNFPEILIANQNSTFSVYVDVTNHNNKDQAYQVQTKINKSFRVTTQGVAGEPVNTYDFTLEKGKTYEKYVTLTENDVGSYTVVFELWRSAGSAYVFTQDYCVLPIKVVN
jgi:uncharacterized membrane protein